MRKNFLGLLLFAALMATPAFAEDAHPPPSVKFGPGLVPLAQDWRTQAGDDLAWAQPGFDDSAWPHVTLSADTLLPAGQRC